MNYLVKIPTLCLTLLLSFLLTSCIGTFREDTVDVPGAPGGELHDQMNQEEGVDQEEQKEASANTGASPSPRTETEDTENTIPSNTPEEVATFDEIMQEVSTNAELNRSQQVSLLTKTGDYYQFQDDIDKSLAAFERADLVSGEQDEALALRIGRILVKKRRYSEAVDYFDRVSDKATLRKEDMFLYLEAISRSFNISYRTIIDTLPISEQVRYLHILGHTCRISSDDCIAHVQELLAQDAFVNDLKKTLEEYENLGIDDTAFRDTLLAQDFLTHGDPATAVALTNTIRASHPNYLAAQLIAAQALYEIGKFEDAIQLLADYREVKLDDPHATYMQALAYFEIGDIQLTNTLLNEAIRLGLQPKAPAERKLAYTYFLLGRPSNMFTVLGYLMENDAFTEQDASNAIYLALNDQEAHEKEVGENPDSVEEHAPQPIDEWLSSALETFPDSSQLLALRGWHELMSGRTSLAIRDLKRAIALDRQNPLAYFQLGRTYLELGKIDAAQSNFEQVSVLDAGGIFGEQVVGYLREIYEGEKIEDRR